MAYYYFLELALDICMRIYQKAFPHFSLLEGTLTIDDVYDSHGSANLILKQSDQATSFAVINVSVTEIDMENETLVIEVIGMMQELELGGRQFGDVFVESIMKDYENLNPVVKEGVIHSKDLDQSKRKVNRELEVRFRIFAGEYEINEDYDYDYNIDEIGEAAVPYIKALHDIYSRVYAAGD